MNEDTERAEARVMWRELENQSAHDAMNELHRVQLGRIESAHRGKVYSLETEIIRRGIVNEELTETNADLRKRLNYAHLALFACTLVIAYLVVKP